MAAEAAMSRARESQSQQLDSALVRALQADGRASIRELAHQLGVSRDTVSQRIKYLSEHGGLRIVAALDPAFTGDNVLVHVRAEVHGAINATAQMIAALPEVVFVSVTSGNQPLTFESRHRDIDDLHATLELIRSFPGMRKIQVSTYSEVLRGFYVSQQHANISVDRTDLTLISMLQRNGRISFREIAAAVHLSPSTVRARVNRLIDGGVIQISALNSGGITHSRLAVGVGISTAGNSTAIKNFLLTSEDVEFAVRSHGSYDFITTIVGTSSQYLNSVLDDIRSTTGVTAVDSWAHFEILIEDYTRSTKHITPTVDSQ